MLHCKTLKHGIPLKDHKTMGAIAYRKNMSRYVVVRIVRRLFNMIYMLMVKERLGNHQDEVETWE
jgi:hypothetical protein